MSEKGAVSVGRKVTLAENGNARKYHIIKVSLIIVCPFKL